MLRLWRPLLLAGPGVMMLLVLAPGMMAQPANPREFVPGAVRQVDDLPAGRLREQIRRLPVAARDRAIAWLGSFHFTAQDVDSLQVDAAGGIFYADTFDQPVPMEAAEAGPAIAGAALPVAPFPASLVFHSRPGAANVIFLNFSGENVSNTAWNNSLGRALIPAVPFSTDEDYATFSDAEQLAIRRIWQRVAEDYAPFNVDVTTERPATFGTRTAHALITRNTDANGADNPAANAGGVAYVNVFGTSTYATYRPAWIYGNNLASDESYIAEAVAHEVGHNLGLSHDGATGGQEYYGGHGSGETSWGPIMGTGYNRNVSQWSKGEYYRANNTQDDLATIAAKLSYRSDDHGNTAAAATALTITAGSSVLATTPENDPARTNAANKGVLERNTDIDVFSFATGNGPIDLTVAPWTMAAGTRGGNLDLLLELRDASGALLLTNNAASLTRAHIQTNLIEGVYYLHVRNSGAGNPTTAPPTGYTSYGSIGQYFITGSITPSDFVIPPGAAIQITDVNLPGSGAKQFTVTYFDNAAIDVSTIDGNDLVIMGPHGYSRPARLVSVSALSNGTPRVATYAADPPGTLWEETDNGVYTVWMQTNQVHDTEGAAVAGGVLGQFSVSVPRTVYAANMDADPGWTLEGLWQHGPPAYTTGAGPSAGFTGTSILAYNLSGNYENKLNAVHATTPAINCSGASTLTLRFRRWLRLRNGDSAFIQASTNGSTWSDLWSTTSSVSDSGWQEVQYPLPPSFAGRPTVQLRWGIASSPAQNEIGWNIDDVQLLGDGSVDVTPPVATLNVANITSGGSPTHSFTVTFTDDTAVRVASLDSSNLLVTGPNGYSNLVEFAGVDTPGDGSPRTATYSIAAPGGAWEAAGNGTYEIVLQQDAVTDIFNNAAAAGVLGTFVVAITTNQQALVVSPTVLTIEEGGNGVFTIRLAEQPSADVLVTVTHVAGDSDLIIESGATNVFTPENWSIPAAVTLRAPEDADQDNSTAAFECRSEGLAPVTVLATAQDLTPDNVLTISINQPAWGSVNPTGGTFRVGDSVVVTATPSSNRFEFVRWSGSYSGTNNPITVLLTSNVTLHAEFGEIITDSAPPVAVLTSENVTLGGSTTHVFTVTYSDESAIRIASLGPSNLVAIGPNGYSNSVEFLGVDLPSDGTPRTATYAIAAPGGRWSATDNGAYEVIMQSGEVTDTFGNAMDEAVLGGFLVAVPPPPRLVVSAAALEIAEGSHAAFTIQLAEQPSADILVSVLHLEGDPDLVIQSGATNLFTPASWSNAVPVVIAALPDGDQENGSARFECRADGAEPVTVFASEEDTTPDNVLIVSANNTAWGSVTAPEASYPVGAMVEVLATPATYFEFVSWAGSYFATNNPITVVLETNVTLEAIFREIVTTNHATPHWWLAAHGYTDDFEAAETRIGANGLPLWQSHIAGLDPNDATRELRLRIESAEESGGWVLRWNTAPGRIYALLQSTNLAEGFAVVPGASSLPDSIQAYTNLVSAPPEALYRLEVRKP